MMRSPPATDNVMIKIWKFTEFNKKRDTISKKALQNYFNRCRINSSYNIYAKHVIMVKLMKHVVKF